MSNDKDDLELEALQRKLDDAFATTRPRRGFEDELWVRMQAKRPLTSRLRDTVASIGSLFREAPAVPIGAVAVLLVVVIGAGVLLNSGLGTSKGEHTAMSANAPSGDLALSEFGKLPTPGLHPGLVDQRVPSQGAYAPVPAIRTASDLYFGPANLRWTGQMPLSGVSAPVYRYAEPGAAVADQFGASLGASSTNQPGPGYLGSYSGQGLMISVRGSVPQLPKEPDFVIGVSNYNLPAVDDKAAATNFLDHFSLVPSWPYTTVVMTDGGLTRVVLQRNFDVQGGSAFVVDWNGERYGIEVDISDRQVRTASGPLPLSLDATTYRLISNDQAVRTALVAAPASSQRIIPVPTVNLDKVELVYALAFGKGQGFYEPAYLFSGTFSYNGQTYTKRVLVPLVDPSLRY